MNEFLKQPFRRRAFGLTATLAFAWSLTPATCAGAEASLESRSIERVHAKLSALGYPIRSDESAWTVESDDYLRRVQYRLGLEEQSLTPQEAEKFLSSIDPSAVPCFRAPEMNAATTELAPVQIGFFGQRPDEYLADFYVRFAECYPEYLRPQELEEEPLSDPAATAPLAFPVLRSQSAIMKYREAGAKLAESLRQAGGKADRYAQPVVVARRIDRTERVVIDGASAKGRTRRAMRVNEAATRKLCADYGYEFDCLAGRTETLEDSKDGGVTAIIGAIPHFGIALRLDLPRDAMGPMLVDAIDFVRSEHKELQSHDAVLPIVDAGPRRAEPLQVRDPNFTERRSAPVMDQKQFNDLRKAIGWVAPGPLEDRNSTEITVADPGFDFLEAVDMERSQGDAASPFAPPPDKGNIEALKAFAELMNGKARKVIEKNGQKDELGHGVHVAYLIGGRSDPSESSVFDGLATNLPIYFAQTAEWDAKVTSSVDRRVDTKSSGVVNRSYSFPGLCSSDPTARTLDIEQQMNSERDELTNEKATVDTKKWFDVVAAHEFEEGCKRPTNPKKLDCTSDKGRAPLVCLGKYARGVAVVPLRKGTKGWIVADEIAAPGEEDYSTSYDIDDSMMWIGAPAVDIYSGDVEIDSNRKRNYGFRKRSGSSMAAPIVTALASRIKARFRRLQWFDVKKRIFATATPLATDSAHRDSVVGMVNFQRALNGDPTKIEIWYDDEKCPGGLKELPRQTAGGKCVVLLEDTQLLPDVRLWDWNDSNDGPWSETNRRANGDPFAIVRDADATWRILSVADTSHGCKTSWDPCVTIRTAGYAETNIESAGCWISRPPSTEDDRKDSDACFKALVGDKTVPINFWSVTHMILPERLKPVASGPGSWGGT